MDLISLGVSSTNRARWTNTERSSVWPVCGTAVVRAVVEPLVVALSTGCFLFLPDLVGFFLAFFLVVDEVGVEFLAFFFFAIVVVGVGLIRNVRARRRNLCCSVLLWMADGHTAGHSHTAVN